MTTTPRPWQRHRVRQPRPDVAISGGAKPLAQITIYDTLTLLARRDATGLWRQYPVSAAAIAEALSNLPRSSGILPPDTLATGSIHGHAYAVMWLPPVRFATLRTLARDYTIPLPPLVWAGCGDDYRIYALGEHGDLFPTVGGQPLYCAPMPNTYASGAICWGDSDRRPQASPATLMQAWGIFIGSYFNSHIQQGKSHAYPGSVLTLWELLSERIGEPYPLNDLVPAENGVTLGWLADGGPWTQGGRSL